MGLDILFSLTSTSLSVVVSLRLCHYLRMRSGERFVAMEWLGIMSLEGWWDMMCKYT